MSKNIVLCCDGTGNGFDNPENDSNVVKLYNTLAIGPKQIAYYHPGVGTMGAPNARNRLEKESTKLLASSFRSQTTIEPSPPALRLAPSPIPRVFLITATPLNLHKRFLPGGFLQTAVSDAPRTTSRTYLPSWNGARPIQH